MTPVAILELTLALVGAALILSLAAGRLRLPSAAALVLGGMAIAFLPRLPAFELDPDLIMVLFLPPLLMSSAYFTVWRDFRADLRPILMLSIGAVIFTTAIVGVVARWVAPSLPWTVCFALGAIVSPPDAVAANAVLHRLKLPRRLVTIIEGESLVNDASGLVLYRFAVAAALTGGFSATAAVGSFVWLASGGIGVGALCGLAVAALAARLADGRMLVVASLLASWTTYIVAERIGASGVLATVTCGLVLGAREHEIFRAEVRLRAESVWETFVFVLEALVFVLIGLALRGVLARMGGDGRALAEGLPFALAVTGAVVASRIAWVFPGAYLPRLLSRRLRERDPYPSPRMPLIIGWAGMRGVVTLAAALALPTGFPGRDVVLFASFAVILFTVLIQGTTLGPLIVALRVEEAVDHAAGGLDTAAARVVLMEASLRHLESMLTGEGGDLKHPRLVEDYRRRVRATSRLRDEREAIDAERGEHFEAALGAVRAGREALIRLHREERIHHSVLRVLETELDLEEMYFARLAEGTA